MTIPCDVFVATEPAVIKTVGGRHLRFHLRDLDDPEFLFCDNPGMRGTDKSPSLLVGISLVPVIGTSLLPAKDIDVPQEGAIWLDITLDEVRKFQAQLQRLIDDNPEVA